jgi:AbrB family looped-hinge helix DNA binding protein
MKATVTSKGQITIPLALRRKLNLHAGAVLEFDESADHLKAAKVVHLDRMQSVLGIARKELAGKTIAEWLDDLRGPAELPPKSARG